MPEEIIGTRKHRIFSARSGQIVNNLKALAGGRPYIDARLWRAPNESDLSWNGARDGSIPGRKQRAFLLNDAGRISSKINQYLFAQPTARDGIDSEFDSDVTRTGLAGHRFWEQVSELFTGGQWVWLQVDRGAPLIDPATGRPRPQTVAEREAAGDRVRWAAWSSADVVDWCFDANGRLVWLLTAESTYRNDDPFAEPQEGGVRTLWRAGAGSSPCEWRRFQIDEKGKVAEAGRGQISIPDVPFIVLGTPQDAPWWFDDVELIQAATLNLSSLHFENLVKTVYPQLVIPKSMAQDLETKIVERYGTDKGVNIIEVVRELIRGLDRPFLEAGEDKGLTRYLQPSALDLKAIPDEEDRRRKQLFDAVGLALFNRESRQVQSAESKQFDHLDTEATLRNRAMLLQETETRLVALSAKLDTSFKTYAPVWPQAFDVQNTAEDVAALTQLANFAELPPSMVKQTLKAAMKLLDQIERITPEVRTQIMAEIDQMTAPTSPLDGAGVVSRTLTPRPIL